MKTLIKIEELFFFLFSIYLFTRLDMSWWWFPVLLFTPDLGMIGYLSNPKIGAIIYNIVHHRAVSITIYILGAIINSQLIQLIGIILFAHSTIDRVFDYGLKHFDNFKHTHLSEIGINN